ncbi:MAG: ERF family protein [Candidatus Binataceae bacterium]
MSAILDYRKKSLCVLIDDGIQEKCWFPVTKAQKAEVQTLLGRSITQLDPEKGTYVDEEGNVYQLADKGETKPIAIEQFPGREKTELEALLEASLQGGKATGQNSGPKRLLKKNRRSDRKQQALQMATGKPEALLAEAPPAVERSAPTFNSVTPEDSMRMNLRQKLAEVRRRIGYIQKRGHNERFNYSYVTAADIAGAVGDLLAELGVVVIPRLEEISYETAASRGEATRMARVVMAYTFADVDSGERLVAKVAGQGLDPGDKAPYKAMTGALKYALLQSFLLATGDDPEDERPEARYSAGNAERPIGTDEIRTLKTLIDETETDLERVLSYYKVASLEELTESAYRRAVELLNRKLAKLRNQETVHAQD